MSSFLVSTAARGDAREASSASRRFGRLIATGLAAMLGLIVGAPQDARAGEGSIVATPSALTASGPDFNSVTYRPLTCGVDEPVNDESPGSVDLVGDARHRPTYFAWDNSYLYFRFRVTANPTGTKGFDQNAWVVLIQVPSGDPLPEPVRALR
jgi:hypothetical protein